MYSEDIIPVTFMGGTGGQFLASFLSMANHRDFNKIPLSPHGNAHLTPHIPLPNTAIDNNSMEHIESLLKFEVNSYFKKPYFVSCHIADVNLLSKHFHKSIRIVYDEDDVSDIVSVYLGKRGIDELHYSIEKIKFYYNKWVPYYKLIQRLYFNLKLTPDNILFVSWKELFHLEPKSLIKKLSVFTNIPQWQFAINNLLKWRKITRDCLNEISKLRTM